MDAGNYLIELKIPYLPGDYSFSLKDIEQAAQTLIPGEEIIGNFDPRYETDIYQFEATEGERFFFDYISGGNKRKPSSLVGFQGTYWRLADPSGEYVFEDFLIADREIELTQTGMYTLFLEDDIGRPNFSDYRFQVDPIAADLVVSNPIAPSSVTWGQPFNLQWQVGNQSSINATGWSSQVYISEDETLDEGDRLLDSFTTDNTLTQGDSYNETHSLIIDTLEIADRNNWYLLVDITSNQRDKDLSNNTAASAIELLTPDHPDLVVDLVTTPLATAFSGSNIDVSYTVSNIGDIATKTNLWRDRIILSTDNTLDSSDRILKTIEHQGILTPNASYTNTTSVKLTEEISGDYYLFAVTDINNNVFELLAEDNNTGVTTTPIAVSLKPVPDLVVEAVNIPETAVAGTQMNYGWLVANRGEAAVEREYTDRSYLSSDGTLNGAIPLKAVTQPPLAASSSYEEDLSVVIPEDVPDGEYQLVVVTDADRDIFERTGENNNQLVSISKISITHADIVPTITSAPESAVSGETIALLWSLTNEGTAATPNDWLDRIYLSTDDTLNTDIDTLLSEITNTETLAIGETEAYSQDITIPISAEGEYYLLFNSDSQNEIAELEGENNNLVAVPITVELAPYANLAVSNIDAPTLTIDDPASVEISYTVTNNGNGRTNSDRWLDRIILSEDEVIGDRDDLIIAQYEHDSGLDPNTSYTRTENILLPPGLTGRYRLLVQTDSESAVFENNLTTNNLLQRDEPFDVMPIPYADLRVTNIAPNSEASSGQPLTVSWSVINEGIGLTSTNSWTDELYLASDPEGKNKVEDLGSFFSAGALAVGNSYTRTVDITLPEGIEGTHYIVAETGGPFEFIYDDNNTLVSSGFEIALSDASDLIVSNIIAPATITAGEKIDLTWTVDNQGAGVAQGSWRDDIYLQEVGNPDAPLTSLASFNYSSGEGLGAGFSYTRLEKIGIPEELEGLYRVVVETNIGSGQYENTIYEGNNTENNRTVDDTTIQINLPPRPDLQVSFLNAPDIVSAGGTISVEFDVINSGTVATNNPNWTDTVYLSLDNEISSDDIVLGNLNNGAALNPGESYSSTTEPLIIPQRFRGEAYVIVETDANNTVEELPQENNNTKFQFIEVEFSDGGNGNGGGGQPSDLVTSGVVAPQQAFEGSTIDVTYKVTNKGINSTNSNSWTDTIWLTRDKNRPSPTNRLGDEEDILLETITHNGALAVDEEYERTVSVTIPDRVTGEWYITPWSDTYDVVLEDTFDININPDDPNELDNNNYKARPITLLLTPPPDLVVTEIEAPATALGGDTIDVSYTVTNQAIGAIRNETWVDRVYLSDKPTLDDPEANVWTLGSFTRSDTLSFNESYTQNASFDLSPATKGSYIIVETNADTRTLAYEGPYTDNNVTSKETDITTNPADLIVQSVEIPETVASGELMDVSWTVQNQGASMWSGTKYWYDEVWLSPDPEFIEDRATFIGSYLYSPEAPLGTGDTYTQTEEIRLPAGIEGEYYIYVSTDYSLDPESEERYYQRSLLTEGDNSNTRELYETLGYEDPSNNKGSGEFDVIYREPDLEITSLNVPDTVPTSGETIPIGWRVTNNGTRETRTDRWYDRVYLSQDATLDFQDTLLGSVIRNGTLDIDTSYEVNTLVTLPENIEGDYHLLVFTDSNIYRRGDRRFPLKSIPRGLNASIYYEQGLDDNLARVGEFQDEGNNITSAPLSITLRETPDLQVTSLSIPERATVGQSFELNYGVTNEGLGDTLTSQNRWSDFVYLSRDKFLDLSSDRFLTSITHSGGLRAGESYSAIETVDLPTNIEGQFYVFVISDPNINNPRGIVFEGANELNNSLASTQPLLLELPPPADLVVEEITLPSTALSGDNITIEWSAINNGPNAAKGRWSDSVYLSTDGVWDIGDRLLGRIDYESDATPRRRQAQGNAHQESDNDAPRILLPDESYTSNSRYHLTPRSSWAIPHYRPSRYLQSNLRSPK